MKTYTNTKKPSGKPQLFRVTLKANSDSGKSQQRDCIRIRKMPEDGKIVAKDVVAVLEYNSKDFQFISKKGKTEEKDPQNTVAGEKGRILFYKKSKASLCVGLMKVIAGRAVSVNHELVLECDVSRGLTTRALRPGDSLQWRIGRESLEALASKRMRTSQDTSFLKSRKSADYQRPNRGGPVYT